MNTQYTLARREQDQCKKEVETAGTNLDVDQTDLLTELFGAYATLLAHYYKTPEHVAGYFNFLVLPPSYRSSKKDVTAPASTQPPLSVLQAPPDFQRLL